VEGAHVRRLEERDIDAAIALTDLEGWGYTPSDFRRLLHLSPDGCFAAEIEAHVVGVLTTTTYDGLAFLGAVIVSPELRGKGVGKQMMEAALAHLRQGGVKTVRLNAYLNAVRFYERLGFHGEYEVIRWHGAAAKGGRTREVRRVRPEDIPALVRFDVRYFGADRQLLLERLVEEFPRTFLVAEREGRPSGFIVGSVSDRSCEIGPWVVEPGSRDVAEQLFQSLVHIAAASQVAFSGPSPNADLVEFVREHGFAEVFRALRMWYGANDFAGEPRGIWAAGGLEKG
jgi:ribosomal protein S18 acetylase RimI-like enzyme